MSTRIISFIGWLVINAINMTLRVREVNALDWWKKKDGLKVLFSFWHGEQLIPVYHHRGNNLAIMSSLSKDGEIQTGVLKLFGNHVVRGSSSRGAERALVETIRMVKKGLGAAFAVDGPRGPFHKIKPGIAYVAIKTGKYIIPLSAAAKRFKVLERAWDKYEVAMPFSSAVIVYGKPVKFDENEDIEKQCMKLEGIMEKLTEFSHKHYWSASRDLPQYLSNHPYPKILIVQPSRIGDVVFTMPAVAALRKKYPQAWIGWLVDERCAPVIEGCSDIDEVIIIDKTKYSLAYLWKMKNYLRSKQIDLSIDFHGLFKSAAMVWLAGARFKLASSSTNGMREFSWLFSREIKTKHKDTHCVERHMRVAEYLEGNTDTYDYNISTTDEQSNKVRKLLESKGIDFTKSVIAMHPGGGWIARRWDTKRFAQAAERLTKELGAQIILVGGKEGGSNEKGLNEEVISGAPSAKITDMTGMLSLKESIALLKNINLYIGNEAGPMHLAVALKAPVIALIGPTIPGRTGPFKGYSRILRHTVECQPCRKRDCTKRACMDLITVDEVVVTAKEILSK